MAKSMSKERHSVTDLLIHLVCVTKYRRPVFTAASLDLIKKSFGEVAKKMDFQIQEFNGEADHISSVGGASIEVLKQYIKEQLKPS
jgi:putative transposase